jgi:hypothetical protein
MKTTPLTADQTKTHDRLWASLAAARISTLKEFVEHVVRDDGLSPGEGILLPNAKTEPVPPHDELPDRFTEHPYPSVPLVLDGRRVYDREELNPHKGKPLYYTPVRSGARIAMAAFTSRKRMIAEASHLADKLSDHMVQADSEHACTSSPDTLGEQVCFFEHIFEGGGVICLPPGRAYSDLTRVGRNLAFWWYTTDWNDVISSVSWCRWDVSLFEHINYGGSQLWLPAGCTTPNLVELGWNDVASSIVNWGQRFSSQPILA